MTDTVLTIKEVAELSMIFKKSTTMIIEKYSTEYLKNNLNLDV
ncbi:Uncharacterised protein [Providencia rettgeri]|nr:Uncharacterised protein [Providencia rettgeri]CAC9178797.1 Uncharacterised protein [Providencia rettgeri]CAD0188095.1 Hypothetical_protein [Providencia rettgeri]